MNLSICTRLVSFFCQSISPYVFILIGSTPAFVTGFVLAATGSKDNEVPSAASKVHGGLSFEKGVREA
jgi:hypothetical protein